MLNTSVFRQSIRKTEWKSTNSARGSRVLAPKKAEMLRSQECERLIQASHGARFSTTARNCEFLPATISLFMTFGEPTIDMAKALARRISPKGLKWRYCAVRIPDWSSADGGQSTLRLCREPQEFSSWLKYAIKLTLILQLPRACSWGSKPAWMCDTIIDNGPRWSWAQGQMGNPG